jgi:hypothetical protein
MKTITLGRSWHFWLANFGHKRIYADATTNICEYTRAVLTGTFWAFVSLVFAAIFGGWVLASIGNIIGWVFLGYELERYSVLLLLIVALFSSVILIFMGREWWDNRPKNDAPPTFVGTAYRKFKSKTCFEVEFK